MTLGRYRLIAELGRGGMGTVYLAALSGPARFRKVVVIKQLRPAFVEDSNFTAMFLEEARLAARLHHANIVQTNEVVCHPEDGYFMVMEYLEGASLRRVLRRLRWRGDEPARSIYLRAILDVLTALEYAHTLQDFDGKPIGLVHRDVNPSNVMVLYNGQVKLLDFGIAKAADSGQETRAGILKGKLHYMSPEQMAGDRIDCRADVFAVGAMLWDALTGRRLWEGMKGLDIMTALVGGAIASPRSVAPNIAENLNRICMRALAFRPADRYPDARSLRADLELALGGDPMPASDIASAMATEFAEAQGHLRSLVAEHLHTLDDAPVEPIPNVASQTPPPFVSSRITAQTSAVSKALPSLSEELASDPGPLRPGVGPLLRRTGVVLGAGAIVAVLALFVRASGTGEKSSTEGKTTAASKPEWPTATPAPSAAPAAIAETPSPPPVSVAAPASAAPTIPSESASRTHAWRNARAHSPSTRFAAAAQPTAASPSFLDSTDGAAAHQTASGAEPPVMEAASPSGPTPTPPSAVTRAPAPGPLPLSPAAVDGTLSLDSVRAVVRSHSGEIQRCSDRARMDQLYFTARVVLSAIVAPDGRVSAASTSSTHEGTGRLQACIQTAVQGWTFPEPTGGMAAHVTYTFVFE